MNQKKGEYVNVAFMDYCPICKRKHRMKYQSCPTCNIYETAQPVSEKVQDECRANYSCDGCLAYMEHEA